MNECEVVVGDSPPNNKNVDCYWFDKYITEQELKEEVEHLNQFYDIVRLPTKWPPQIREREVRKVLDEINVSGILEQEDLRVDNANRVVVPAHLRKRCNIAQGDRMVCYSGKVDGKWYLIYTKKEEE